MAKSFSRHRFTMFALGVTGLMAMVMMAFVDPFEVEARGSDLEIRGPIAPEANVARQEGVSTITIEAVTESVSEVMGPMRFRLSADPAPGSDVDVTVEAEEPELAGWLLPDYWEPFTVKIAAGNETQDFDVPLRNLFNLEGDGSIEVRIVADGGKYSIGSPSSASVDVMDDEVPITVTYDTTGDISVSEGDGAVEVGIKLTVDEDSPPGTYATEDGVAEGYPFLFESILTGSAEPDDFGSKFFAVNLPAGSFVKQTSGEYVASVSFEWEIIDDDLDEEDEYFFVLMPFTAIPWLTLPTDSRRVVIEDDDVADVQLRVSATEVDEGESITIWAEIVGSILFDQQETVNVTICGDAKFDEDYSIDNLALEFAAESSVSTNSLTLLALEDDEAEPTETLEITLSGCGDSVSNVITLSIIDRTPRIKVIMMPDRPIQSMPVAANLMDDGGVSGAIDWEWSVSNTSDGMFSPVQNSTSNLYSPTERDVGKFLKAKATYSDMHGVGKSAETVSVEPVGADLPSSVATTGRVIVDGGPVSGYIDRGYVIFTMNGERGCSEIVRVFDHDWWGVEVIEGRNYVVEMRGLDTNDGTLAETRVWGMADTDGGRHTDRPYVDVYDAYGDIGSGEGRNSRMVFTAPETGLVYIDVSSNQELTVEFEACPVSWYYPERQVGSYELEVTSVHGALEGQNDATRVAVGTSISGTFDDFERRWLVVALSAGTSYEIVHRLGDHASSNLNFPVIYGVYNRGGVPLRNSSVGVHGYDDAVVTVSPVISGDYYIQIGDGTQGGVWVNGGPRGAFHVEINQIVE